MWLCVPQPTAEDFLETLRRALQTLESHTCTLTHCVDLPMHTLSTTTDPLGWILALWCAATLLYLSARPVPRIAIAESSKPTA